MILGNETHKVSVVRALFSLPCASGLHKSTADLFSWCLLMLLVWAPCHFQQSHLTAHQPEIFFKDEKYYIISPPQETVIRTKTSDCAQCARFVFPVYCLSSCLLPFAWVLYPVLSHFLLSPPWWSGKQDQVLARDGSGYRCHFPHLGLHWHSASHSNRALFCP